MEQGIEQGIVKHRFKGVNMLDTLVYTHIFNSILFVLICQLWISGKTATIKQPGPHCGSSCHNLKAQAMFL